MKIAVIGPGLLGGSFIKAVAHYLRNVEIYCYARNLSKLKQIYSHGIISYYNICYDNKLCEVDLVVLAVPILNIPGIINEISKYLTKDTIVTDLGSTKYFLHKTFNKIKKNIFTYIGSHPIAGSEKSGFKYSDKDLFKDNITIITKDKKTNNKKYLLLKSIWEKIGSKVITMEPKIHDKVLAITSHSPHLVSTLLFDFYQKVFKGKSKIKNFRNIYGSGFMDVTRLAAGHPDMWLDIIKTNKSEITNSLQKISNNIMQFTNYLETDNYDKIKTILEENKKKREKL